MNNFDDIAHHLKTFCQNSPGTQYAILVSAEGLLLTRTQHISSADAERMAALTGSLTALTRAAATTYSAGTIHTTTITMNDNHHLTLLPVTEHTTLVYLTNNTNNLPHTLYQAAQTAHTIAPQLQTTDEAPLRPMFLTHPN